MNVTGIALPYFFLSKNVYCVCSMCILSYQMSVFHMGYTTKTPANVGIFSDYLKRLNMGRNPSVHVS